MDRVTNTINKVINFMEQDIRAVHIGCYSIALIGLTVAVRKVRPFSRFKKPSDIPNHFIVERRELQGFVERIEPSGALLMVQHQPLVPIPGTNSSTLPVKVSGVNISGLGISWLQTIVAGNKVKFVPIFKDKDSVHCEVVLPQVVGKKERNVNVGESLVAIGFATIEKPLKTDNSVDYCKKLETAENQALRKRLGLKYYIKPTKQALVFIKSSISDLIKKLEKQSSQKVPKVAVS